MKKYILLLLLICTLTINAQPLNLDKLTYVSGAAITASTFYSAKYLGLNDNQRATCCFTGIGIASLPILLKVFGIHTEAQGSNIVIKLKYKKFKCIKEPYKSRKHKY